jgi:hypothetical protein
MSGCAGIVHITLQCFDGLALRSLLSDAPNHRRDQRTYVWLDFVPRIPCHEYVCIGVQALSAPIGTTALEVGNLLDARIELRLPRIFGNVDIFAIEDVFDRVCAVGVLLAFALS